MGESIIKDLKRDNNYRYFVSIKKRIVSLGFFRTLSELRKYYLKYVNLPKYLSKEKIDLKYKLFVFYNYFKIIYVHPQIETDKLLNYFPTRLQRFFIYDLDPKEKRKITNDKLLFYRELLKNVLPFPETFLYVKDGKKLDFFDNEISNYKHLPKRLFAKPRNENGGVNAKVISNNEIEYLKDGYILQEMLTNHEEIAKISSYDAFNTIRAITYIDKSNEFHLLAAIFRFSNGKQVDNWGAGSINVDIDLETGKLEEYGITKYNEIFLQHPKSKILFKDFEIPCWNDLIITIKKAAYVFPYLKFIAWDIGISDKGPIIVEANAGCDFFHAQLFRTMNDSVLINDLIYNYSGK